MYAIIQTGGKQYKVSEKDEILIERLEGNQGDKVEVGKAVLINKEGAVIADSAALSKVKVKGTIVEQLRDKKVIVFKYKPKKDYRRKKGHRQLLTRVRIDKISLGRAKKEKVEEAVEA
ncbi:MAG: 50S ribosomal protein L21 [Actinobacteria bacterium]|nr:50S ribosomal protein L21 [Actinomycetota bacterium]